MGNNAKKTFLAVISISLCISAFADGCNDWPEGSSMNEGCKLNEETATFDAKLNKVYSEIIKSYASLPDQKKKLVEAEVAWIKYRDKTCDFENQGINGIGSARCFNRLTKERVEYLERLL